MKSSALCICSAEAPLIDLVYSHTPAIVLATGNPAQDLRLERLSAQGYVRSVVFQKLKPEQLVQMIQETLAAPYPKQLLDMQGAQKTGQLLTKLGVEESQKREAGQ